MFVQENVSVVKSQSNTFWVIIKDDLIQGTCTVGLGEIGLVGLKFKIKTRPLGFGQEI